MVEMVWGGGGAQRWGVPIGGKGEAAIGRVRWGT